MRRDVPFLQVLTPLSLSMLGGVSFLCLSAFALVWTSLNEFRSGRAFRSVLEAYGAGVPELAIQRLPDTLAAKPKRYAHPRLLDALLKLREGKLEDARRTYQDVLDEKQTMLTPKERALALNGLGVVEALAAKDAPDAPARRAAAKARFEEAAQAWPELPENDYNLAMMARLEGNLDGCRKRLAQCRDASRLPPGPDLAFNLALAEAALAEQKGKFDDAAVEARRALAYRPGGEPERVLLGRALSRKLRASPPTGNFSNEPDVSETFLGEGRVRPSDCAEILLNVAAWRMEDYWSGHLKSPDAAAPWATLEAGIWARLNRAAELDPKARGLARLRAVAACRSLLWRAVPASPADAAPGVLTEVSALAALEGLDDRTRAAAENDLGWILVTLGRLDEGVPHLEKAVALAPAEPAPALNLAVALDRKGDAAGARAWYAKTLAIQPGQPEVQARLAALDAPAAGGTP